MSDSLLLWCDFENSSIPNSELTGVLLNGARITEDSFVKEGIHKTGSAIGFLMLSIIFLSIGIVGIVRKGKNKPVVLTYLLLSSVVFF